MSALSGFERDVSRFHMRTLLITVFLIAATAGTSPGPSYGEPEADADTGKLQLEVDALISLNDLQLTHDQFTSLKDMITDTTGKVSEPSSPIAPGQKAALSNTRAALLEKDQKKIEDAEDKLDQIQDKQDPDSDPEVEQSEPAKEKAEGFLKTLTPVQVTHYLSENADDVHDPAQLLLSAVHRAQGLSEDDFGTMQDDTADDVRILLTGPHPNKPVQIGARVKHLLDRVHHLSADDYKTQQASLEDEARQIVGTPDPIVCLRHWMENEIADLLSNPQLGEAINEWPATK